MEIPVPEKRVRYKIVIEFDVATTVISVNGCDESPLVALGMLDYALARVRRVIGVNDMLHDAQQTPLIQFPRGRLS